MSAPFPARRRDWRTPLTAYSVVLFLHSWTRWFVVAAAAVALVTLVRGLVSGRAWGPSDAGAMRLFLNAFYTQVLLGLVLYFALSPLGFPRQIELSVVMKSGVLRYFAIEHPSGMVIALVAAHAGWALAKRARDDLRLRRAVWAVAVPFIIILVTFPWPWMPYGRSLFRLP